MNNFSNEEFECHFLDEGFTAKDILDQKINEVSSSVSILIRAGSVAGECRADEWETYWGLREMKWNSVSCVGI